MVRSWQTKNCIHCDGLDSLEHRLWFCPASESVRGSLDPHVRLLLDETPSVCRLHGWTLSAPSHLEWLRYLDCLPADFEFRRISHVGHERIDLFTDGSCYCQESPSCRVAAWSVLYSDPVSMHPSVGGVVPLAAQPLKGVVQSAFRAELTAVLAAVSYSRECQVPVTIWCDCLGVVRRFRAHFVHQVPIRVNQTHADLWLALAELVADLPDDFVRVCKVSAHETAAVAPSAVEEWLTLGNCAADRAAKAANTARPPGVWALWTRMVEEHYDRDVCAAAMQRLILEVSKLWGEGETSQPVLQPTMPATRVTREFQTRWETNGSFDLQGRSFVKFFGGELADKVRAWLQQVTAGDTPVRWISYIQLYLCFQLKVGPISILKRKGVWHVQTGPAASLQGSVRFTDRVKYFRLMLQQFMKDCKVQYATATLRPHSEWIACHRGCLSLPFHYDLWFDVERVLSSQLSVPCNGQGEPLRHLRDP